MKNNKQTIMTTQERELLTQQRECIKLQKEASVEVFKHNARFKALEVAQSLNPNKYTIGATGTLRGSAQNFNIIEKSEEIYQWLIKSEK